MSAMVAALLGALIGAAASILTIIIQQRYQNKRDLLKVASEISLADYKEGCAKAREVLGTMPPISAFVHYHFKVLEHMAEGTFTRETIQKLSTENADILDAYHEVTKKRVEAKRNAT
jgi:hypothetical protein